jgi:hypothetical protein
VEHLESYQMANNNIYGFFLFNFKNRTSKTLMSELQQA